MLCLHSFETRLAGAAIVFVMAGIPAFDQDLAAQPGGISLRVARAMALASSPELSAARDAVAAARGRERQAHTRVNPALSYSHEQTAGGSARRQRANQDIVSLDQPVEWPATVAARVDAARLRREAAEARVSALETQIAFDIARAYAATIAADRRAVLADDAARAFEQARTVAEHRLAAGDVAGLAARRIRLEAARYAALRAEARLASRSARVALMTLTGRQGDTASFAAALTDSLVVAPVRISADSLVAVALARRADLMAASLDADALAADAQLARRERMPVLTLSAGPKLERSGVGSLAGFVAGVSIPLALWDRRAGAIEAADAETRRRQAEILAVKRQITKEVRDALDTYRAAEDQLAILSPEIETDARTALRAAQAAYAEGEISLLEWLDTVRAYHETESALAGLRADLFTRRAAVARSAGLSFPENVP
jgi:outer membrane protein, heavy metal efflux system